MQQSKLGYPYSYGDELTPEMAEENIKKLVMILLLFWALNVKEVRAAPLPGADGFVVRPNTPRCRRNQNQCRNYGILSRASR